MDMKKIRFLLILIIGVAFLNSIFSLQIVQKYNIKGNLVLSDEIRAACSAGTDHLSTNGGEHYPDHDSSGGHGSEGAAYSEKLGSFYDKLFFAGGGTGATTSHSCALKIYSPNDNSRLIYSYDGLSAPAIKTLLNNGIMVGPIQKENEDESFEFLIKIVNDIGEEIISTSVTVPNLNYEGAGSRLISDSVEPNSILSRHIKDREITFSKLGIFNSNSVSNNYVIGWSADDSAMKWIPINGETIQDGSIDQQHLKDSFLQIINNKVSKQIHTVVESDLITYMDGDALEASNRDEKYLKFSLDGDTYLIPIFKLNTLNPILNFVPPEYSAHVTNTINVLGEINDIEENTIEHTIANNNGQYIEVISEPSVVTVGGEEKLNLKIKCLNTTLTSPLPKITVSGNAQNDLDYSDSFDINCTPYPDAFVHITTNSIGYGLGNKRIDFEVGHVDSDTISVVQPENGTYFNATPDYIPEHSTAEAYYVNLYCNAYNDYKIVKICANKESDGSEICDYKTYTCKKKPNGGCFLEGTKVYTPNGWRNIEELNTNDVVYSLKDTKLVETKVIALLVHGFERALDPSVKLELSNGKTLFVTLNHAMYSPKEKNYKQLKYFNLGDSLLYYNETAKTFEEVMIRNITELPDFAVVYNLALESPNNYLVEGIVVHNDYKHDDNDEISNPSTGGGGL